MSLRDYGKCRPYRLWRIQHRNMAGGWDDYSYTADKKIAQRALNELASEQTGNWQTISVELGTINWSPIERGD